MTYPSPKTARREEAGKKASGPLPKSRHQGRDVDAAPPKSSTPGVVADNQTMQSAARAGSSTIATGSAQNVCVPAAMLTSQSLYARYPALMTVLPADVVNSLEEADLTRIQYQAAGGAQGPVEAPMHIMLDGILDDRARYVDVDIWRYVYQQLSAGADAYTVGMLVRNEIDRRWFSAAGLAPDVEDVEISLADPMGNQLGPSRIDLKLRGRELYVGDGLVTLSDLDDNSANRPLADIVAEVTDEMQGIVEVVALEHARDALDKSVPDYERRVRSDFAKYSLMSINAQIAQIRTLQSRANRVAQRDPAAEFAGGLAGVFDRHIRSLTTLLSAANAWHQVHQPDQTYGETYYSTGTQVVGYAGEQWDKGGWGYVKGGGAYAGGFAIALFQGLGNIFTFGYQNTHAKITQAYRHGEISEDTMEDLSHDAAIRSITTGFVTAALTVATAGLGSTVAGGIGLTRGTLAYGFVASGTEGALINIGTLGTETLLTDVRPDYRDPVANAIWQQGSHSVGEIALGGAMGFGFGGLVGMRGAGISGNADTSLLLAGERGATVPEVLGGGAGAGVPAEWEILRRAVDPTTGVERTLARHASGELFELTINAQRNAATIVRQATGETFHFDGTSFTRNAGALPGGTADVATSAVPDVFAPIDLSPAPQLGGATTPANPLMFPAQPQPLLGAGAAADVMWVNTRSGVAHPPDSRWFGATKEGIAMPRDQAESYFRTAGEPRPTNVIDPLTISGRIAESTGASPRGSQFVSARAQTPQSVVTAIIADTGESLAYKTMLNRGEYGLQRPLGSNVPGVDFITVSREFVAGTSGEPATMRANIYLNDAKVSGLPQFPTPATDVKSSWVQELADAISNDRLQLGDPQLEQAIRDAVTDGRVYVRQINVDMSSGIGAERVSVQTPYPASISRLP